MTEEEEITEELREMTTITHGLIAIDKRELVEDSALNVLHFTGFWERPQLADILALRSELETDEEFGCTEIMEHIVIIEAPEEVFNHYKGLVVEAYNKRTN